VAIFGFHELNNLKPALNANGMTGIRREKPDSKIWLVIDN